jgi:thymidine kinase
MIEVICGGMFAGKSEMLIHRLKRAAYAKKSIVAFKPSIDKRYSEIEIASHSGQTFKSVCIEPQKPQEMLIHVDGVNIVGIDEAQFFDSSIIEVIDLLQRRAIDVYIAGLDLDSMGRPFGSMPHLLSIADKVTKISAVCVQCGEDATRSQRLVSNNNQVLVGATDSYEARCFSCWYPQ